MFASDVWMFAPFVGGGIGFLAGFFGVGGGFLLVPALALLLGVPAHFAVGSTACYTLGPATTALLARKVRPEDLRLPLILLGGLSLGVFSGALLLEHVEQTGAPDDAEDLVLGTYFALLAGTGLLLLAEVIRGKPWPRGWINRIPLGPFSETGGVSPKGKPWTIRFSIPLLAWFGLAVGFLSGITGMGGGLVLLPGLMYFFGLPAHTSARLTLITVWITSFQATAVHAWNENVDLGLTIALLVGGTFGAKLGTEHGLKLSGNQLRAAFGLLLILWAIPVGARVLGWL